MKGLDFLLSQGEPEDRKRKTKNELTEIRISQYAFDKAYAYARLVNKISKKPRMECGGYLTAPKDSDDRVARDAFLARDQDVSEGLFTLNAEDVIKAGREIDAAGQKVLGWWHSHGTMDTFFSELDDQGQMTVLNEIAAFNYINQIDETEIGNLETHIEDGKIVMFDKRNPQRTYEVELSGDPRKISIAKLRIVQDKKIGFAYGLVVNNRWGRRKPYAEIATRDFCSFCKSSRDQSKEVGVNVVEERKVIINEEALRGEIREKVTMKPRYGYFGSLFGAGDNYSGQGGFWWQGSYGGYGPYSDPRDDLEYRQRPLPPIRRDTESRQPFIREEHKEEPKKLPDNFDLGGETNDK